MAEMNGKIGTVTIEVKPTVTLESAVACVMMLNMFLDDNEDYKLVLDDDGGKLKWALTDKPLTCGPLYDVTQAKTLEQHFRMLAELEDE